jgi:small subunit ribosomal protein S6
LREYELTFVVQPEISDEGCEALQQKLDAVLAERGSIRLLYDDWGKRKLAYEIDRFQKGHYFVLSFLDEGQAVPALERVLRLEESALRFLTVLVDEQVKDIEARKAWAAEEERVQAERRAERAAREAEEAKAREAAEQARAAEDAERAAAAAAAAAQETAAAAEQETAADVAEQPAEGSGAEGADEEPSVAPGVESSAGEAPQEPAADEAPKEKPE